MFKRSFACLAVIALAMLFFVGCSDPSSSSSSRTASLAPPTWIQGEWEYSITVMGHTATQTWTFTESNAVLKDSSTTLDFAAGHASGAITVTETESTDTQYTFTANDGTDTTTYSFAKSSDTTILFDGLLTYTKK